MQQVSTHTSVDVVHRAVPLLGVPPGGSPCLKAKTSSVSGAGTWRKRRAGEALLGVRSLGNPGQSTATGTAEPQKVQTWSLEHVRRL